MDNQEKINNLLEKLEHLAKKQEVFSKEVADIKEELIQLKSSAQQVPEKIEPVEKTETKKIPEKVTETSKGFFRDTNHRFIGGVCSGLGNYLGLNRFLVRFLWILLSFFFGIGFFLYFILWIAVPKIKTETTYQKPVQTVSKVPLKDLEKTVQSRPNNPIQISNELEKFIGENLINKIGIAILIIGVAIGAKYSIENDLISPLTRIILGYLLGLGLLVLAGFGASLIPLAYALSVASPAISAFGDVIKGAFEGIASIITATSEGLVSMLGVITLEKAGAMIALGAAFPLLAVGIGSLAIAATLGGGKVTSFIQGIAESASLLGGGAAQGLQTTAQALMSMGSGLSMINEQLDRLNPEKLDALSNFSMSLSIGGAVNAAPSMFFT